MALKPADLKKLTDEEKQEVDSLEKEIDNRMLTNYIGNGEFVIQFPRKIGFRIVAELRRRYSGIDGWTITHFSLSDTETRLVFTPNPPPQDRR